MKQIIFLFLLSPIFLTAQELSFEQRLFGTDFYLQDSFQGGREQFKRPAQKISKQKYFKYLESQTESAIHLENHRVAGNISLITAIGGLAMTLYAISPEGADNTGILVAAVGLDIATIALSSRARNELRRATAAYNDKVKEGVSFRVGIQRSGVGFSLHF